MCITINTNHGANILTGHTLEWRRYLDRNLFMAPKMDTMKEAVSRRKNISLSLSVMHILGINNN